MSDRLCLRDSDKAKVKVALLEIGKPATKDEISAECDLSLIKVGGALSNIPSIKRADRLYWGLEDWIQDEYDGIPGEILQRIEEHKGVVSKSLLLREIPNKFDVKESSVNAYLRTPQFDINGDEVRVAEDPDSKFKLRDLDKVVSGKDHDGSLFWNFTVQDRHFKGHNIVQVPYEIVRHLGCAANKRKRVRVSAPLGCENISVNSPMASLTMASIGHVSDALKLLKAKHDDLASIVMRSDGSVEIRMAVEQ